MGVASGGVLVADEVAAALDGELAVLVARKIGSPVSRELAIGAVAADGGRIVDETLVARLGVTDAELDELSARAVAEVQGSLAEFGPHPPPAGRTVIVVDDGVATGATLRAALGYVRRCAPAWLVCAIPVGPPATIDVIAAESDEVVCPLQPERFRAVGEWYRDFAPVFDREVTALLDRAS
jgi:putative phosphoribosyl transferase